MERIRKLNWFQKAILIAMAAIILFYTAAYYRSVSRKGILYFDEIFVPSQQDGTTVYIGKISGAAASFTVAAGNSVTVRYNNKTYGPFNFREDPSAIPSDSTMRNMMTGLEIEYQGEIIFRGAAVRVDDRELWLYDENGNTAHTALLPDMMSQEQIYYDENGKPVSNLTAFACSLACLIVEPVLVHKGSWALWFVALLASMIMMAMIVFAEEIFRLQLSRMIKDADKAEATDYQITTRYIAWAIAPLIAIYLFRMGLQIVIR